LQEPEIFSFAQFTRAHGNKVLEVGVGAGTDFLQWVRAGARAYGVDLTEAAVEHTRQRLAVYGLSCDEIRVADAEALPYASDTFDLVYSWGVIHHSPDTARALSEIVRVCKPGGQIRVMIYNRHSLLAWRTWIRFALLRGHPERSIAWTLAHHVESAGTKAYTVAEAQRMLAQLPVHDIQVRPMLTTYDVLGDLGGFWEVGARTLAGVLGGNRVGWFLGMQATRQ
jgi:ubiquinone/menaquinone biosynthesis C-methylase UbiE